ncbi:unnamed protein product [Porites lobata]|uniref:Uncharacterized protein n=1 Tax=Porites lobata TaxID=104759 RepID=A0ABN8Q320_9CNID|nr:unnamed protein product [Porites lobata]
MLQNKERSPSESLPSQFKAKILECFGYTTAHGYGRVAGANESLSRRWFWLLVCAAAYGLFAYQLHDIILQYSARPLKTRAWIAHQQKLPFPQVTVCNLNKIRLSRMPPKILEEFPQILSKRYFFSSFLDKNNNKTDVNNSVVNRSRMGDHDLPHGDILKEKIEKRLAEYPESVLQEAGHQLDDMLLKCQYDSSMECMDDFRDLWTQLWHPKYGNCFSFNRGRTGNGKALQLLTSSIPGHDNGLQLELNAEQYEYVSELTDEAGIRVFIGTQNVMPFPYELGISVAPGYSTGVMLRKIVIGKLDPFNNDSCEPRSELERDNIFQRYDMSYSDLACKISCLATSMNSKCGCVYYTLKYHQSHDVCDGSDVEKIACVNDAYDDYSDGKCENNCRQKCRSEDFKMTVSAANWPSEHSKKHLRDILKSDGLGNHSNELNLNFLKLKVYYGQLNFEVLDEEYAYTFARFLSDIGGIMGMWIGISALTCVEVLELMMSLCYTVLRKIKGKSVAVLHVQPNDSPA